MLGVKIHSQASPPRREAPEADETVGRSAARLVVHDVTPMEPVDPEQPGFGDVPVATPVARMPGPVRPPTR